jgi:RNA polymerase sigma-70 factor (ECF subfamily)
VELELGLADSSQDDEALVRLALAGDAGAFDRLVERYAARTFRMIRAEVRDASEAEDLVQETFLRAFVALPKFRFDAQFYTWLYRIMLNTIKQHQRKTARRYELNAKAHRKMEHGMAADAVLEVEEARAEVQRALADLPEKYRTAVLLREWAELTYAEIAQILECPIGTVDSRIARARHMLAERLAPDEDMR